MVMRLVRLFCGLLRIKVRGAELERFLNACAREGIHPRNVHRQGLDEMTAELTLEEFRRLARAKSRLRCRVHIVQRRGFPFWQRRVGRRYGLLLAALLLALTCYELNTRIWVIETNYTEGVEGGMVVQELDSLGIGAGTKAEDIDVQELKLHMMTRLDNLAFFAANINGNTLSLEAAAAVEQPEKRYSADTTTVIAQKDGVIQKQIVRRGTALYKVGDAVTAGEQLVDAVVPPYTEEGKPWLTDAYADIWAETRVKATRVMPSDARQKRYTGEENTGYALRVGKMQINLWGSGCFSAQNCDRIRLVHVVHINEHFALPVSLLCVTCRYYQTTPATLDDAILRSRLEYGAKRRAQQAIEEGNVIETKTDYTSDDGQAQLTATTRCYEQIGCAVSDSRRELPAEDEEQEPKGDAE